MDDPWISRAYERARERVPRFSIARSGLATTSFLVLALVLFGIVWHAHRKAQFHRLRTPVNLPNAPILLPGGQEAVTLSRVALLNGTAPEYMSATILPGLGMQLLQITVAVPDHATRSLLLAPTAEEVAAMQKPVLDSAPFHLHVSFRHDLSNDAATDLIGLRQATNVQNLATADGGQAEGSFPSAISGDADPMIDTTVTTSLSGRSLDLVVSVANKGQESRAVTLDWSPHFRAPSGNLSHFAMIVPSKQKASGSTSQPIAGTPDDFSSDRGTKLSEGGIDATFVALKRDFLGDGPVLRLIDLDDGTTLRMTALSPSIRSIRARTDPKSGVLMLSFSTADPTATGADSDAQMLRAGQTLAWHVRMEVLATSQTTGTSDPVSSMMQ